jgi:hypothetical protein
VTRREISILHAEIPLQLHGIPALSGTMVCSQMAVASETWVTELSPKDPRILVAPFSTGRPSIRAGVLELTL